MGSGSKNDNLRIPKEFLRKYVADFEKRMRKVDYDPDMHDYLKKNISHKIKKRSDSWGNTIYDSPNLFLKFRIHREGYVQYKEYGGEWIGNENWARDHKGLQKACRHANANSIGKQNDS